MAGRFAKAPTGIRAFSGETKMDSAKEGGRPAAPPGPLEDHRRDFAKRSAVPRLRGDFEALGPLYFFEKGREARVNYLWTAEGVL